MNWGVLRARAAAVTTGQPQHGQPPSAITPHPLSFMNSISQGHSEHPGSRAHGIPLISSSSLLRAASRAISSSISASRAASKSLVWPQAHAPRSRFSRSPRISDRRFPEALRALMKRIRRAACVSYDRGPIQAGHHAADLGDAARPNGHRSATGGGWQGLDPQQGVAVSPLGSGHRVTLLPSRRTGDRGPFVRIHGAPSTSTCPGPARDIVAAVTAAALAILRQR